MRPNGDVVCRRFCRRYFVEDFVEDIEFRPWGRGFLRKHSLDFGFGAFVGILSHVCKKRNVDFLKVDKNYTSQGCPNCNALTGKKL